MNTATLLLVMLGGALGTGARHLVSGWMSPASASLPWGTVTINVAGSFVIGVFGALTLAGGRFAAPEPVRLFVMVGLCGGFTTFSAFSLQTIDLLRAGAWGRAGLNVGLSVVLCLAATAAGYAAGAQLNGHAARVARTALEEQG